MLYYNFTFYGNTAFKFAYSLH